MKPILFSTPMVQAILEGRKTQTRRIINPQPYIDAIGNLRVIGKDLNYGQNLSGPNWETFISMNAKYHPGDILYVRERIYVNQDGRIEYHADWQPNRFGDGTYLGGWKSRPSIYMPKALARTFLKATAVKAERLHDITEADAIAEGIESWHNAMFQETRYKDYEYPKTSECRSPISSFRSLWQSINGPESWNENPYVFAYTFERCEKPNF